MAYVIPNRIHFIFGLEPSFGGKPFSFLHYLAVRSAISVNKPDKVFLHYTHEPRGLWWEATKPLVVLNYVAPRCEIFGRPLSKFAHKADVLRLEVLLNQGGIYLDIDTFCVRPFEDLRTHPAVMGIEPNAGLCNAVILAEPNSEFVATWLDSYRSFDETEWNHHSVRVPYRLALDHPSWVQIEDEYSFFFPTYDDPMYLWLWQRDIGLRHRMWGVARVLQDVPYYVRNGGPLSVAPYLRHALSSRSRYLERLTQSYCLHLWESLWWDAHLRHLNPEWLRESESLFAQVARKVLHADLNSL